MRIGELARRTGVSERSIRYYESKGLLVAERTSGGHREFDDGAVDRVIRIQELLAAGLGSKAIEQVLPCSRDSDGGPTPDTTPWLSEELARQREQLDLAICELQRSRDVLDEVIDAVRDDGGRETPAVLARSGRRDSLRGWTRAPSRSST